ncbi:MAG: hypothetical protein CMI53_00110 [Parcubacteria group bacterium]|nr:hypothetical protein [Parcubacteria group bacterium]|tara:strand:- start:3340 stop:4767 length:1428 start_codon:yes stop_codon:yes gene_type:complete
MTKDSLAKNTTYYTAALTVQKILAFIYFWFISNSLFPGQLGQYIFALSYTTLFSIFVDLGLSPVLTREASKYKDKANTYLRNVIGLKLPLSIITLLVAWITINFTDKESGVRLLVYLASIIMILDSFSLSFWVIFRSRQNLKYESIATILVQIIIFSLGVVALKTTGEVKHLIMALLAASAFNFLFSLILIKVKLKFSLKPQFDPTIYRYFLRIIPAFALAGIFVKIYNTSDTVLLSFLNSDESVAYFAIPAKVVYAFQQIIPAAFAAVIFPAFSYYYKTSKKLLTQTFDKAFNYLTIISLPITAGLLILIPEIIRLVWPSYHVVIPAFFVMALAIPFIFLAFPTGYLLNATDRQRNTTINRGVVTVLAIVLNIILIPKLDFFGAGITFFVTNVVLLILDFIWVRKVITLKIWNMTMLVFKSVSASAIMILGIYLTKPYFHLIILVPFGAIVYFLTLSMLKGFSFSEIKSITNKK